MEKQLSELLDKANIRLGSQQQQQLLQYLELLQRWNNTYNLTAIRQPEEMLTHHIMDSLAIIPWLTGQRFIDAGTGAGLPGIPLAIALPDNHFTLLDSQGKRIRFLHQVHYQLKLTNISVVHSRAEHYRPAAAFDGIISRAFSSLSGMLNWCQHLADNNSRFYAMKGQYPEQEIDQLPGGMLLEKTVRLEVAGLNAGRHLVIIRRNATQN